MQGGNFKLVVIIAFFVVSAAPESLAQSGGGKLNVACGQDIQKLCAGTENKEARKCLRSHRAELSGECKAFFQEARARRQAQKNNQQPSAAPAGGPPTGGPPAAQPPAAGSPAPGGR